jgi:hypothetical protein
MTNKIKSLMFTSKSYSIIFLILTFTFIIFKLNIGSLDKSGWFIGDWLINYSDGGFKRRGLAGNLFFLLQNITGFQLNVLVEIVLIILYSLFFYILLDIIWEKKINFLFFTLLLSPLTFLFYFNDTSIVGRKELIVFLIYVYFIKLLVRNNLSLTKDWVICIGIVIATLIHEFTFVYMPYFLFALFLFTNEINLKRQFFYASAFILPFIFILLFGKNINEGNTFQILLNRGLDLRNKVSIFTWPDDFNTLQHIKVRWSAYFLYLISFLWCLMHFGFYVHSVNKKQFNQLLLFFVFAILFSTPIFIKAIDWGRWLHIHFTLFTILLLSLTPNKNDVLNNDYMKMKKNKLFVFVFVVLNLFVSVQHCDSGLVIHHYKFQTVKRFLALFV